MVGTVTATRTNGGARRARPGVARPHGGQNSPTAHLFSVGRGSAVGSMRRRSAARCGATRGRPRFAHGSPDEPCAHGNATVWRRIGRIRAVSVHLPLPFQGATGGGDALCGKSPCQRQGQTERRHCLRGGWAAMEEPLRGFLLATPDFGVTLADRRPPSAPQVGI